MLGITEFGETGRALQGLASAMQREGLASAFAHALGRRTPLGAARTGSRDFPGTGEQTQGAVGSRGTRAEAESGRGCQWPRAVGQASPGVSAGLSPKRGARPGQRSGLPSADWASMLGSSGRWEQGDSEAGMPPVGGGRPGAEAPLYLMVGPPALVFMPHFWAAQTARSPGPLACLPIWKCQKDDTGHQGGA